MKIRVLQVPRIQASTQDKGLQHKTRSKACIHVSYSSGPHLSIELGSSAGTCPADSDLTSLSRWAPALPCILQLQTLLPYCGGLRCYHVARCNEPRLPAKESSSVVTCPTVPDSASLLGRASTLPHVLQFPVGHMSQV
jgi:hypothetical protein